tara:strand:- start:1437 stop:1799 length:363 start_codon:yes stop_codon:yes gene_type:complete
MSIFRKGGLRNFGRNLFKKQATGINKIFTKVADGLDFAGSDKVGRILNNPIVGALAERAGLGNALATARVVQPKLGQASRFARAGAEVPKIYSDLAEQGFNPKTKANTIERVSKLAATLA